MALVLGVIAALISLGFTLNSVSALEQTTTGTPPANATHGLYET